MTEQEYGEIAEMARIAYGIEIFDELDAKIAVEEGLFDTLLNLYNAGYKIKGRNNEQTASED